MSMMTKKEALASIRARKRMIHGNEYTTFDVYLGMNVLTKKPVRLYAMTKKELEEKIDDYFVKQEAQGSFATVLTSYQVVDALEALKRLKLAKVDLTLTETVKAHLEHLGTTVDNPRAIGEAYDEYLKEKPEGHDKDKTVSTVGKFVGKAGRDRLVSSVKTAEVESYLKSEYEDKSVVTYNSHFSYISTFFNWCAHAKRRYIMANPLATLDKKPVAWKDPKYMKVEEVEKLFRALEKEKDRFPHLLAHAITNFFTGARREEILRMSAMDDAATIHIEDETMRIAKGKGYTRGRAPRTAHLAPNAIAWMKSFDYLSALKTITESTTSGLAKFASKHGIELFRNCGRHTFITMDVAAYGDPQKTQAKVGTSSKMRADHYDGLATKKEGLAYFAIYPTSSVYQAFSAADKAQPVHPVA